MMVQGQPVMAMQGQQHQGHRPGGGHGGAKATAARLLAGKPQARTRFDSGDFFRQ
jgi:hypothetical protein